MIRGTILGTGLLSPGLECWASGREVLAGNALWQDEPLGRVNAPGLPRAEARRATRGAHLALTVAQEALAGTSTNLEGVASVWAAADSDLAGLETNMRTLAEDLPWISPHRFQNSVHNAPAGYWSIATGCRGPATSLAAGDESFAAGLAEAFSLLQEGQERCLLVAHEEASPNSLKLPRPVSSCFAVALLLGPPGTGGQAVHLELGAPQGETPCTSPELEVLRRENPAAKCLPMLEALALPRPAAQELELTWGYQALRLSIGGDS